MAIRQKFDGCEIVKDISEAKVKTYQIDFVKEDLCSKFLSAIQNRKTDVFAPCLIKNFYSRKNWFIH